MLVTYKQPYNNKCLYLGCNQSFENSLQASCQMPLLYTETFSVQYWQPDLACRHHDNKIAQHKLQMLLLFWAPQRLMGHYSYNVDSANSCQMQWRIKSSIHLLLNNSHSILESRLSIAKGLFDLSLCLY